MPRPGRVVLDSSALLGRDSPALIAAVALGFVQGYWSSWIVAEFVRVRTEWVVERATRELADRVETARRLDGSRSRVNQAISYLSRILVSVDYQTAPSADLSWLNDPDDWPIMQTALAAGADTLITDNRRDFPLGEERNGVLLLSSPDFLNTIYKMHTNAQALIGQYLH